MLRRQCGQTMGNVGSRGFTAGECYRGGPIAKNPPKRALFDFIAASTNIRASRSADSGNGQRGAGC
jgi:hypothetical protein